MPQTLDRDTLDRLIALGQARGGLTADDLRAALPVQRMDVDALVLVMLELEEAGVSVDPEAFGPPTDRPGPPAIVLPPRTSSVPPERPAEGGRAAAAPAPPPAPPPAAPRAAEPDGRAEANRAVLLAGLATLLVLGAVLLML
jgi:hypothetical protein